MNAAALHTRECPLALHIHAIDSLTSLSIYPGDSAHLQAASLWALALKWARSPPSWRSRSVRLLQHGQNAVLSATSSTPSPLQLLVNVSLYPSLSSPSFLWALHPRSMPARSLQVEALYPPLPASPSPQPAQPKAKIKTTLAGYLLPLTTLPSPYLLTTSSLLPSSCFLFSLIPLPHRQAWAARNAARPGAHSSGRISRAWMTSHHRRVTLRRVVSADRPLELECHE